MDERRMNIVLLLELYMFFNMIVMDVVTIQTLILQGEWKNLQF